MKEGKPSNTASIEAVSQTKAAEKVNVSRSAVQRARKVIDSGDDDLMQAVDSGKIAVSVAAKIAELPKEECSIHTHQWPIDRPFDPPER